MDLRADEAREQAHGLFPCKLCPKGKVQVFASAAALTQHEVREHQRRNIFQRFVKSSRCPNCDQEYWSRRRAVDHISYRSAVCKREGLAAIADGTWTPLSEEQERKLRDADLKAGRAGLLADKPGPKSGRRRPQCTVPASAAGNWEL